VKNPSQALRGIGPFPPDSLEHRVLQALTLVYDPEIPVNIVEVGLIYDIAADAAGAVKVTMTLTSPMCPVAESLPVEVRDRARGVPGATAVDVDIVWDPPWGPEMMSEAARLELGML
jgi:FeS assembly SUF system protein